MNQLMLTRRQAIVAAIALLAIDDKSAAAGKSPPRYKGVNLAGGEFGTRMPGVRNSDYTFASNEELDYYVRKGANIFRIPFKWERLQPVLGGPFAEPDAAELDRLVDRAAEQGASIILGSHDFGRRSIDGESLVIGESDQLPASLFAYFWKLVAERYRFKPNVMFGLMNEPHDQDGRVLVAVLNGALAAIRATGARNLALVPGNAWTAAHSWVSSGNGELMLAIEDPIDNFVFDVHQYLDPRSSGADFSCVADAAARLEPFVRWARAQGRRGFLGEFGAAADEGCLTALRTFLAALDEAGDVWLGWTYWAGGPGWGDYPMSVEPVTVGAPIDRPQMRVLEPFLRGR